GLPYLSSGDPRTAAKVIYSDKGMGDFSFPVKFWPDSDRVKYQEQWTVQIQGPLSGNGDPKYEASQLNYPFTLANWEEAVLIHAEATLRKNAADGMWLRLLNTLRATAPIPGTTQSDPAKLVPLKDPGSERGRVALLFAERAYWLFLTGHRQGDLRRLVREYHWPQDQVYPTGPYIVPENLLPSVGQYGMDMNLPIPPEELVNPLFYGCVDRGA
ncbi:MAG TPA: RagB/SusD family nutrient uptake outer membrane protein, partial [Gemmatimonadaceae bacterium]|nr:RagB/SusD family nutrient uptake outer membrane protein [Gemmatimonadaceae bacterium]